MKKINLMVQYKKTNDYEFVVFYEILFEARINL